MSKKNFITISELAIKQFQKILTETNNKNIFFSVKGGGYNGFGYKLEPNNINLNTVTRSGQEFRSWLQIWTALASSVSLKN